jgi:hypothetical protein
MCETLSSKVEEENFAKMIVFHTVLSDIHPNIHFCCK